MISNCIWYWIVRPIIIAYFSIDPIFFNDLGRIFYFTEPATVFFTNLIHFHDEVCFFLVWILVFTYWMLYSILIDHIYHLRNDVPYDNNYIFLDFFSDVTNNIFIFFYSSFYDILNIKRIDNINNSNFYWIINIFLNFLKNSILTFSGAQISKNFQSINNLSFFEEKGIEKFILNKYDINTKLLFSGINSNILSTHGKLLEIEELFLLTHLSTDYNILIFSDHFKVVGRGNNDNTNYDDPPITDDILDNINNNLFGDQLDVYYEEDYFINEELAVNYINHFNSFDLNKKYYSYWNDTLHINFYSKEETWFDSNYIFDWNLNIQEKFFYNRRFNQISYFFNPYLEIFNDIFSLNDNNNELYNFKEPGLYKWWEFKYLYIMTRASIDYSNLSKLSRGINRDIIIDSWEYNHSISFEYIWALFPTLVILSIIGPSFILLFTSLNFNDAFLSVKVIGHQWYWSYELSSDDITDDSIKFDSRLEDINIFAEGYWKHKNKRSPNWVWYNEGTNGCGYDNAFNWNFYHKSPAGLQARKFEKLYGFNRLLSVNKHLILIAHKPINFLITSGDVLHSFAIPAFGIKVDAVPGRINTFYMEGSKVGKYYGQCSELCGFGHGFMPIVVEVVKHEKD